MHQNFGCVRVVYNYFLNNLNLKNKYGSDYREDWLQCQLNRKT